MGSSEPDILEFDLVQERRGGRSERVRDAVMGAVKKILQEQGYSAVTHRAVATLASVDNATVYRRWPTRPRLVSDMLNDLSVDLVPVPDTGSIESDLTEYLTSVASMLSEPGTRKIAQAFFTAMIEGDDVVGDVLREFWKRRFSRSYLMFERAVQRRELSAKTDRLAVMEALVAPAWFRSFVSQMPIDDPFQQKCVRAALNLAVR